MKALLLALALSTPLLADELPASLALKTAATAFLASLDEPRLEKAKIPFADAERENWHYTPRDRAGLSLKDMNEAQKNAAVGLVTTVLSEKGAYKAAQIISLEGVLAGMENDPVKRDQEKYFTAIFGNPGDPQGWGFRIEGHHLSINFTIVGDQPISVTPTFMGSNPAEVREGESKGLRPLAEEEDLGRALAASLKESGRVGVIFDQKPPNEILTGEERVAKQLAPVGVTSADMTDAQSDALNELIAVYAGRLREDLAEADLKKIAKVRKDQLHFGWAGSTKPGEAYYYRIQGPTFLIEAANVQNNANHMHTVWRDLENDFGRDLLKEHVTHDH